MDERQGDLSDDAWLRLRDCATALGMSEDFIQREVHAGRLAARQYRSAGGRIQYRVAATAWHAYLEDHWPQHRR